VSVADRSMGLGIKALRGLAGLDVIDRVGLRSQAEQVVYTVTKQGFKGATAAGRTFSGGPKRDAAARAARPSSGKGLFDLTPTDEQQMLKEAMRDVAAGELRPAALDADTACAAPEAILRQGIDLGLATLSVPEELDGAASEASAVTGVLVAEELARGDLGLAVALLAPAAVSTLLALHGDADQQSTYLPAFVGEEPPAAALAILEPRPLFDALALQTTATRTADGFVLRGVKSLVPRAADAELLVVAAALEGHGPALFLVEPGTAGAALKVEAEPAMGARAAGTGTITLDGVAVPAGALIAEGDPQVYRDVVRRARLGWCAVTVGCAQAVLDYVIPYVNERHAFGEPISHRQAVAFMVSDIAIEVGGMRLATYRAASRADQGEDFARETALARRLCADKGSWIGSAGVQLLGGHGYTKEYPVERWYRDLRAAGVMEGALLV
jgi:alkylation response protein AidB-like acyl-CoA dehydrogenase